MNDPFIWPRAGLLACLVFTPFLSSCKRLDERIEITATRPVSDYEPKPNLEASSRARFGVPEEQPAGDPLEWQTPAGWTEVERTQMRPVNLIFGPNGEGECYLSILPGGGGGVAANVNRWRKQMGLPDLSEEEIAALPKRILMGIEGVFLKLDGAYTNVGAAEAVPDQRLIGVIAELGATEMGLFVKMVGPKALVEANETAFDEFVSSLRLRLPAPR